MADRRMFSKFITDSDGFLDMPLSAQALYFHLGMSGDDEGFVASPRKVQRSVGGSGDDLKLLIAKGFVIPFNSGVMVITHWHIHNTLRKDRFKKTVFTEEREQLFLCDNGAYTLADNQLSTTCQPNDNQPTTNCSPNIREDNIIEDNISKIEPHGSKRFAPPSIEEVKAYCVERNNSIDPQKFIDYYTANGWKVGRNKMRDWKATVRTWEQREWKDNKTDSRCQQTEYQDFYEMLKKGEI